MNTDNNIINFFKYKERKVEKKETANEFARGREPLYVSHQTGKVTGKELEPNFGDRLSRIRNSLERINSLMAELKRTSNERL